MVLPCEVSRNEPGLEFRAGLGEELQRPLRVLQIDAVELGREHDGDGASHQLPHTYARVAAISSVLLKKSRMPRKAGSRVRLNVLVFVVK